MISRKWKGCNASGMRSVGFGGQVSLLRFQHQGRPGLLGRTRFLRSSDKSLISGSASQHSLVRKSLALNNRHFWFVKGN